MTHATASPRATGIALIGICFLALTTARGSAQQPPVPVPAGSPPPPTTFQDFIHGTWSSIYDWSSFVPQPQPPANPAVLEFGHACLIATGSHRGKLLL